LPGDIEVNYENPYSGLLVFRLSYLRAKQECWPLIFIQVTGHHLRSDENDYDFEWLVGEDLGGGRYGLFVDSILHMDTLNRTVSCRHQHG